MARDILALLKDMRNNPAHVRFADAVKVCEHYFGPARHKGSHRIFRMPWAGDPRINLQDSRDDKAKPYQIRQLLQAIERLETIGGHHDATQKDG